MEKLWLVGDNFLAETFRPNFKKSSKHYFIRDNYDVTAYCSSRYSDKNNNIISRTQISVATALNKEELLPKFIVIWLDEDILSYLAYNNYGMTSLLGEMMEWLVKSINEMVTTKKQYLPQKSKRENEPMIYWVAPPTHKNFDSDNNAARTKFSLCIDSIVRLYNNMRMIKIKQGWCQSDTQLVMNNKITTKGLSSYWSAVDNSLSFNINKREEFMVREAFKKMNADRRTAIGKKPEDSKVPRSDEVPRFFEKRSRNFGSRESKYEDNSSRRNFDKFLLPKPKYY